MAKIPQKEELDAYKNKTIRPSNFFVVNFSPNVKDEDGFPVFGDVRSYHAVDVQIQEPVEFQRTGYQRQGAPFARPVKKPSDGYEFTITFEETKDWIIQDLIRRLESRNINENGTHTPFSKCFLDEIYIESISPQGYKQYGSDGNQLMADRRWTMIGCFFVHADPFTFTYANPGKITRKLTFCCRNIDYRTDAESL